MTQQSHIAALQSKHEELDHALHEEFKRPNPDTLQAQTLKRRKLKIKDEIQQLIDRQGNVQAS